MVVATFKEGVTQEEIRALIPAYRATLLNFVYLTHKSMRDMRKNLVEVFARVRVNLQEFTVNFAVMRANLRAEF